MGGRYVLLLLVLLPMASARQNSTRQLRTQHSLSVHMPNFLVLLGEKPAPSCQCTFDDTCSCGGALKFMDCVKKACNSGDCQCMEKDGTNHFLESCSAMADECPGLGLKCMQEQATCKDDDVAWSHSKIKGHAVEQGKEETQPAKVRDPKKYVLHDKYKTKVRAMETHGHRMFAEGCIVMLVLLSVTIALASSSNGLVAKNTWSIIDWIVVHFLSMAWFIVVIHMLDFFQLEGARKILAHMVTSVVFLLGSEVISWRLRTDDNARVAVFNGIFTPMVMWCNAGFVGTVQKPYQDSSLYVFAFIVVMFVWYILLSVFFHYAVEKYLTRKGWGDDVVSTMAGGALAGGFVLWCHMLVTGTYHSLENPHDGAKPSTLAVILLNSLSVVYIALSLVTLPILNKKKAAWSSANVGSNNYWKGRLCGMASTFMGFLPYFSCILSLSHLILNSAGFLDGSVRARLLLALTSTAIGILLICLCAYVPALNKDTELCKGLRDMLLGLGGFIAGAAWCGVLDNSINMMAKGEGYAHPFLVKLAVTGFLSAFIFPCYIYYLKPIIAQKTA